jgi:hypothetical protein
VRGFISDLDTAINVSADRIWIQHFALFFLHRRHLSKFRAAVFRIDSD